MVRYVDEPILKIDIWEASTANLNCIVRWTPTEDMVTFRQLAGLTMDW